MPTQRRAARTRLVAALAALAAAGLGLSACSAAAPFAMPAPIAAALQPGAGAALGGYGTAKVIDDPVARSVLVVPAHPIGSLAVFVHGSGQSRSTILRDRREFGVARELVAHGYLVLAADAGGRAWGDPASVADYRRLIAATVRTHRVHDVFLMAESMGGLATMQLAAQVPAVRAVTAWYPVCDLRTMQGEPHFAAAIAKAWGSRDRHVVSPVAVPAVPLMVWASPHDTVVPAAGNAAVCAAEDRAAGGAVTSVRTSGNHGDPSNFRPADVLAFFDGHRAGTPTIRPAAEQSAELGRP